METRTDTDPLGLIHEPTLVGVETEDDALLRVVGRNLGHGRALTQELRHGDVGHDSGARGGRGRIGRGRIKVKGVVGAPRAVDCVERGCFGYLSPLGWGT
jgi:hypothetical protein